MEYLYLEIYKVCTQYRNENKQSLFCSIFKPEEFWIQERLQHCRKPASQSVLNCVDQFILQCPGLQRRCSPFMRQRVSFF